jgi:hypothetical protein
MSFSSRANSLSAPEGFDSPNLFLSCPLFY